MAANKKFTPRASTNLIEDEVKTAEETPVTPAEGTEVTPETPDTVVTPETDKDTTSNPEGSVLDEFKADEDPDEVTPETKTEGTKEESKEESNDNEVTFTAKNESKPIERKVKIRLAKKYDGCIGGVWYHFEKDQVVNVPENVKRILNSDEGMLKPL